MIGWRWREIWDGGEDYDGMAGEFDLLESDGLEG
jgi:hypothetical protein